MVIIYGLIDPRDNQLRYVGKTGTSLKRRLREHIYGATRPGIRVRSRFWLRSLIKSNLLPDVFVIEEVDEDDWVEAEQFWIAYFRMIGADLCNHTDGGEGQHGLAASMDTIEKRRLAACKNRDLYSEQSRTRWAEMRDSIISAQNAGKGYAWRQKQSELSRARMERLDHPLRLAAHARRKLSDSDVRVIRQRASAGEKTTVLARCFGVHSTTISHIKSGRDR